MPPGRRQPNRVGPRGGSLRQPDGRAHRADGPLRSAQLARAPNDRGLDDFLDKLVGPQPLLLWLEGRANSAEPAEGEGGEPLAALSDLQILSPRDNLVNQKVIGQMLKKLGCQADIAVDGAQAVSAVERGRFDVVFMDVHMPEMDGYEATRALRSRLPQERQPHIIALTANAIMGDRVEMPRCRDG